MKSLRKVKGISLMGFIIIMAVGGFFAYLGMRIGPAYLEYYNVVKAMKSVAAEPAAVNWTSNDIWNSLNKRMYISYVDSKNVGRKNFEIKKRGLVMSIRVRYERRDTLMYNLDYVASFDKTIEISGRMAGQ